jgi:recombination protein RecR
MKYPSVLLNLIRELGRLPGIGPKSAQRLAFHLFNQEKEELLQLARSIEQAASGLSKCPTCFNVKSTERHICTVCDDPGRDHATICVVEQPADLLAIERSGEYRGIYHVLHGALSPMNGIGPDQLTINGIEGRLTEVTEVILATSTTVEGEATAMYLGKILSGSEVALSRIAYGLPVGGDLEYADEVTLGRAITHRNPL